MGVVTGAGRTACFVMARLNSWFACLFSVVVLVTAADGDLQDSMRPGGSCICICSLCLAPLVPFLNISCNVELLRAELHGDTLALVVPS